MEFQEIYDKINLIHLDDIDSLDHPSSYISQSEFDILIYRYLDYEAGRSIYNKKSFLILNESVFEIDVTKKELIPLKDNFTSLYQELNNIQEGLKKILLNFSIEIDKLEDMLYDRDDNAYFMDTWFDFKKDLLKFERYFYRNELIFMDLIKKNKLKSTFPLIEFQDVDAGLHINSRTVKSLLGKMDGLQHYYNSIKNDRLNKNIYFLTLISAVFLPLNLIVGFFGINTEGLFFKDNPQGTQYVLYLLGGSILLTFLGLRILKLLDKLILKRLLRKYDAYQGLIKNIEDLFEKKK